jgi:hypothetical protein
MHSDLIMPRGRSFEEYFIKLSNYLCCQHYELSPDTTSEQRSWYNGSFIRLQLSTLINSLPPPPRFYFLFFLN